MPKLLNRGKDNDRSCNKTYDQADPGGREMFDSIEKASEQEGVMRERGNRRQKGCVVGRD